MVPLDGYTDPLKSQASWVTTLPKLLPLTPRCISEKRKQDPDNMAGKLTQTLLKTLDYIPRTWESQRKE